MERRIQPRRESSPGLEPLEAIVPSRAVLTELARGFLLLHERDPDRASRFAATFLREQVGSEPEAPLGPHPPFVGRVSRAWTPREP